jgi:hypothetical protein
MRNIELVGVMGRFQRARVSPESQNAGPSTRPLVADSLRMTGFAVGRFGDGRAKRCFSSTLAAGFSSNGMR